MGLLCALRMTSAWWCCRRCPQICRMTLPGGAAGDVPSSRTLGSGKAQEGCFLQKPNANGCAGCREVCFCVQLTSCCLLPAETEQEHQEGTVPGGLRWMQPEHSTEPPGARQRAVGSRHLDFPLLGCCRFQAVGCNTTETPCALYRLPPQGSLREPPSETTAHTS